MIEHSQTDDSSDVLVNLYSKRSLKRLLNKTGFNVNSIKVRKLVQNDLPGLPLYQKLFSSLSPQVINWLEKKWGWYLVAHAQKQ